MSMLDSPLSTSRSNRKRSSSAPNVAVEEVHASSAAAASATPGSPIAGRSSSAEGGVRYIGSPRAQSQPGNHLSPSTYGSVTTGGGGGTAYAASSPPSAPTLVEGYDDSDDPYASHPQKGSPPLSSLKMKGGKSQQFDLCTTLYKRRGGFGRNAENNWVKRCFTLKGPILCYYDTPTLLESDPSRPRGRLNLAKEETRAEMSTKYGTHSPTEFLVHVNIYVLGSKRKWELCCLNDTDQRKWYEALRVWDGPPDMSTDEGGSVTPGIGRNRRSSNDAPGTNRRRRGGGGAQALRSRSPSADFAGADVVDEEDVQSIEVAPSFESTSSNQPGAVESTPLISNRHRSVEQCHRSRSRMSACSPIDQHVVVSFIGVNVAIGFARFGDDLTFYLSIFLANLVVYFLLDHVERREEVRRLRLEGGGTSQGDGSHGRSVPIRTVRPERHRSRAAIPSTVHEDRSESFGLETMAAVTSPKRLVAGSTISRANVKPEAVNADIMQSSERPNAETVAAYAKSTINDYNDTPFSYWNIDASILNLRIGPNYKKEKKKAPSSPALYDLLCMDAVQDDCIIKSVADGFQLPDIPGVTDIDTGCPDVPPLFITTVNIPTEEPAMFGAEPDGPSCIIILYFTIAKRTLEQLKDLDNASPAVKLFVEYCQKGSSDEAFRSRLKALAWVEDMEKLGLPSFIVGYNGKPALITKSGKFTRHDKYIEMTVNVHRWGYLARKGLYMLRDEFPRFNFNVGFTIEGRSDSELPETLLGGARMMEFDLQKVGPAPGSEREEAYQDGLATTNSWS